MGSVTVNISFQEELLADIDAEARREARSRSELLREAARLYVERQRRWEALFSVGDQVRASSRSLTEAAVAEEIAEVRRRRAGNP